MLLSVIVPIYNVEKYLRTCVESVLTQTYRDFELILVDDGSKDNCGIIVDEYASRDTRVIVVHQQNMGLVSARKAGLQKATGEYIVVLDGDDWLEENALACVAAAIKKHRTEIVCFGFFFADGITAKPRSLVDKEIICSKHTLEKEYYPTMMQGNRPQSITQTLWGKAFCRPLYEKYQNAVDNRITMGEDGVVVFPCMYEAESICFLPECLYCYRSNPDSMVRSKKKLISWEGALLRIQHLKTQLPLEKFGLHRQLGCYAAHAIMNVVLTQLSHRTYSEVKAETRQYLSSSELMEIIRQGKYAGSLHEKMAQAALRSRSIWLIKLFSILR